MVKDGTWDERARQLAELIHSLLRGQPYSYPAAELHPRMEGDIECALCWKT